MTIKVITTYSAGGYTLEAKYSDLYIEHGGGFGAGVTASYFAAIANDGRLGSSSANYGIALQGGGSVFNGGFQNFGAVIQGLIAISGSTYVRNLGTILGSNVGIFGYGMVENGAAYETAALISGSDGAIILGTMGGATSSVANFGTILGNAGNGVLVNGGSVTNGGPSDLAAMIVGTQGVDIGRRRRDQFQHDRGSDARGRKSVRRRDRDQWRSDRRKGLDKRLLRRD